MLLRLRTPISLTFGMLAATVALLMPGCKSFEESVRPIISNASDSGASKLYVTGTKPYSQAIGSDLRLDLWRIDADPFPDSVLIYARVLDDNGNFISELAPPYYKGGEEWRDIWSGLNEKIGTNERVYPIADFDVREFSDKDGIPYEISLVLDHSGSMGSNIVFLEEAALTFINLKLPQDRISVVKFDDTPQLVVAPTDSKADLVAKYSKTGLVGYGGYTALYSAGRMGGEQVASAPKSNPRALVLFTDGEDNASSITATELFLFCKEKKIPVFAVAFGAVNRDVLTALSHQTGGKFYQTDDPKELEGIFKDIYLSLRNYYLITYRPPLVDGKHLVTVALNPPGGGESIGGQTTYTTFGTVIERGVDTGFTPSIVFFEYNQSILRPEAYPAIEEIANRMKENPNMLIEIQGHTDVIGTDAYNDSLSLRRAEAVRVALVDMGIRNDRLRVRGFGSRMPVAANDTEEGRQRNRRTVFKVLRW